MNYKPHPKQLEFFKEKGDIVLYGGSSYRRRKVMLNKYEIENKMGHMITNNFQYHAPSPDQQERYVFLRNEARVLAYNIVKNCPPSREQSLAITKLEEAIFWANAAIARNETPGPEPRTGKGSLD